MQHYKLDTTTDTTHKLVQKLQARYMPSGGWTSTTSRGDSIYGKNYVFIPAEEVTPSRIYSWLAQGSYDLVILSDYATSIVVSSKSYPTMCGGTVITAKTVPTVDVVNPTHSNHFFFEQMAFLCAEQATEFHPSTVFRRWNSGIMAFYIPTAVSLHRGGARLVNSISKMISLMQEKDDEFTCDGGVSHQRRRFALYGGDDIVTTGNYLFVTHYEWAGDHESFANGENYTECGYCGSEVEDNGYCAECDEYVYDPDDLCYDDENVSCRSDWIEESLADDVPWERDYTPEYQSLNVSDSIGAMYTSPLEHNAEVTTVTALTCWQSEESDVISSCDDDVDYLSTLLYLTGGINTPFLISSNVGSPSYELTRYVMAVLFHHAEEFVDRGFYLVRPNGMGSNPNERYHYIDSLAVMYNGSQFKAGRRIEDPLESVVTNYYNKLDKEAA